MMRRFAVFLAALLTSASVAAQTFPSRPVKLVVGFAPGGSGDFLTRLIAEEMSKDFGIAVITENRAGAAGTLAAAAVAKAPADGYTVLNAAPLAINDALYKTLPYDSDKELTPVTNVADGPHIIAVDNALPVKNLKELIAYAKERPGKLFMADAGSGSSTHLAGVQFMSVAGVRFTTVHYKGGGPAVQSLIAGDTQVMFATMPSIIGFIRSGRVRALAITAPGASPAIPGIPGAAEVGLPGYESNSSFGLYVPAGTPAPVVKRLYDAAVKALSKPEVKEKIASQGYASAPSASPQAFQAKLRAEAPIWERVVRESGARVD
ncbi:MAG: tripartite tricarboxylate transporter substrate binding protein [Betaproteobacteria bacterium]|nr:MAG: tripartite tricarboxylate transporter substrate binding protein [Betaproteobacteria bacterium]